MWIAVAIMFILSFSFAIAKEEHYVCKKVGSLDKWGVPKWKQDKFFNEFHYIMYIDIYYDNDESFVHVKNEQGVFVGICDIKRIPQCTESGTTCEFCSAGSDGTSVAAMVNMVVDELIIQ